MRQSNGAVAGSVSGMNKFRKFLESRGGQIVAAVVVIGAVAIAIFAVRGFLKGGTPEDGFYNTYVCTETGKSFRHRNEIGETIPIHSPFSGKDTGYPAEACYWSADGGAKTEPTWVVLNEVAGKPGPTFCPDCGRLVVVRNPRPDEAGKPPPTRAEYAAKHGDGGVANSSHDDR
jgi:hypothetical protein